MQRLHLSRKRRSDQRLTMRSSKRSEELESEEIQPCLPDEIMYLIMSKLMVFPMYLARFSAVCKSWHRVVCDSWPNLVQQHQITPLVLLPVVNLVKDGDLKKEGSVKQLQMYNLMGKCVKSIPFDSSVQIIGSSFGWIIVTDMNNSVWLLNPLSKSHISLPPLLEGGRRLVKAVLSKPPPRPEEEDGHFDVVITMNHHYHRSCKTATKYAFLHVEKIRELESLQWTYHYSQEHRWILDVNSICGIICILFTDSTISCCKCSGDISSYYFGFSVKKAWPLDADYDLDTVYLLESSSSEPLVVFRYKDYTSPEPSCLTIRFKILTLSSGNTNNDKEFNKTWNWTAWNWTALKWTEIKTLANDVIFLSENADSVCFQAAATGSKLQHPAADSIYFLDEYFSGGIGVFNVDQNSIAHLPHRPDDTKLFIKQQPIWLMPSYAEILKFSSIG